jgi:hypothetical protein
MLGFIVLDVSAEYWAVPISAFLMAETIKLDPGSEKCYTAIGK